MVAGDAQVHTLQYKFLEEIKRYMFLSFLSSKNASFVAFSNYYSVNHGILNFVDQTSWNS